MGRHRVFENDAQRVRVNRLAKRLLSDAPIWLWFVDYDDVRKLRTHFPEAFMVFVDRATKEKPSILKECFPNECFLEKVANESAEKVIHEQIRLIALRNTLKG